MLNSFFFFQRNSLAERSGGPRVDYHCCRYFVPIHRKLLQHIWFLPCFLSQGL